MFFHMNMGSVDCCSRHLGGIPLTEPESSHTNYNAVWWVLVFLLIPVDTYRFCIVVSVR